jgi:hypothetical protein
MRSAADRKNHEQATAMRNFEDARRKAYEAVRTAATALSRSGVSGPRRLELENTLDHLVTKFGLKDFPAVEREAAKMATTLNTPRLIVPRPPRPAWAFHPAPVFRPAPVSARHEPQSASAWFELGAHARTQGPDAGSDRRLPPGATPESPALPGGESPETPAPHRCPESGLIS